MFLTAAVVVKMASFGALEGWDTGPPHRARPQKQKVIALRPIATTVPFHEKPKSPASLAILQL